MAYAYPIILVGMFLISAATAYYMYTHRPTIKGQDMKPATLDAFNITYCDEGTVLPLIYGTVRVPGNILWFGNLITEAHIVRGPGRPIGGYYYWLDVWQGIGIGLLEIVGLYAGDKKATFTDSYTYTPGESPAAGITRTLTDLFSGYSQTIVYNPGDSLYCPTEPGENATAMNPVAHVFMNNWRMPENQTYLPTIHWVVKHRYPSWFPITNAELDNGDNPAAIIYDLLLKAGETSFDLASFQTAADYWEEKGYGVNISFNEQLEARELIQTVFNYVDGILRQQASGAWELLAYTDEDAADYEITTEDFVEFTITRNSWDFMPNFFIANYTDATDEGAYTRRTVRLPNSASIAMLGYRKTKTIDLTAFTDAEVASSRLWELAKRLSYPAVNIQFKTDLRFHAVQVGDVISVTNSDYNMVEAEFRIMARTVEDIDKNLISFEAEQLLSTLFDGSFQLGGSSDATRDEYIPDPLIYQRVFELPYIVAYDSPYPAYTVLGARPLNETGFNVYISYDGGTEYEFFQHCPVWSCRGTLLNDYLSGSTGAIGLAVFREDPEFESLSYTNFIRSTRFALIGSELIRFRYVNPGVGDNELSLSTVIRGVYDTPVEDHYQDDEIWLFELVDSLVLENISESSFHLKFMPVLGGAAPDISLCTAIPVTAEYKALGHSTSPSASRSPSASASI